MYENAVMPGREEREHPKLFFAPGKRLANYLLQHGCRIIKIQNDRFRPGRLVFVFDWDDVCDAAARTWAGGDRETYMD